MLISAAVGEALYPHPQWAAMRRTWTALYPQDGLPADRRREIAALTEDIPAFVDVLLRHRGRQTGGLTVADLFPQQACRPRRLLQLYDDWGGDVATMARQPPTLAFAAIGQAKFAGLLTPEQESDLLSRLLTIWAVRSSLAGTRPGTDTSPARPRDARS